VRVSARVARAIERGEPVVALESSVFAQGLPQPANAEAARRMGAAIERAGAVAAITAIVRGQPTVGLGRTELSRFLARENIVKASARDLVPAVARRQDGATTVASALVLARLAGIDVFTTGGIGGVHRGEGYDESADLLELSRVCMIVVCSGAKAILDLAATAERLETLGVTVVGYGTDTIPSFYSASTDSRSACVPARRARSLSCSRSTAVWNGRGRCWSFSRLRRSTRCPVAPSRRRSERGCAGRRRPESRGRRSPPTSCRRWNGLPVAVRWPPTSPCWNETRNWQER
jgi:pseudouridylate synthase